MSIESRPNYDTPNGTVVGGVYIPELPTLLKPALDDEGNIQYEYLTEAEILDQSDQSIVSANIARLETKVVREGTESNATDMYSYTKNHTEEKKYKCYKTEEGDWVIECRAPEALQPKTMFEINRHDQENGPVKLINQIKAQALGSTTHTRAADTSKPDWEGFARTAEAAGNFSAAQLADNAQGVFNAEVAENGDLIVDQVVLGEDGNPTPQNIAQGKIIANRFTKAGNRALTSEPPQEQWHKKPGLWARNANATGRAIYRLVEKDPETGHRIMEISPTFIGPDGQRGSKKLDTDGDYGQRVFEGMQVTSYTNPDTGKTSLMFFGLDQHTKRKQNSARRLDMPMPPAEQYKNSTIQLFLNNLPQVPKPGEGVGYSRNALGGKEGGAGAHTATEGSMWYDMSALGKYKPTDKPGSLFIRNGRSRNTGSGIAKAAGNYGGGFAENYEAQQAGFDGTASLDAEGNHEEAYSSSEGFTIEENGRVVEVVLPPVEADRELIGQFEGLNIQLPEGMQFNSLNSMSRRFLIECFVALGIKVTIRPIHHTESDKFDGCFCMGTAMKIKSIGKIAIGDDPKEPETEYTFNGEASQDFIKNTYHMMTNGRVGIATDPAIQSVINRWITKVELTDEQAMQLCD